MEKQDFRKALAHFASAAARASSEASRALLIEAEDGDFDVVQMREVAWQIGRMANGLDLLCKDQTMAERIERSKNENADKQPTLFIALEPMPAPCRSARRDHGVYRRVVDILSKDWPFEVGTYEYGLAGIKEGSFRGAVHRCFKGAPKTKDPTKQAARWPEYDFTTESTGADSIKVHIWRKE